MSSLWLFISLCTITAIGFIAACIIIARSDAMPDIEDVED